ncbi:hypothetical protein [Arthrobacter zhaoxinii]|uniref:hypothetical protein n=1 Tax=Arthrobacter zhaoxinii TaxID=2964616 RepID=UPI0021047553|nr:hypothetical protein [Arthrobacter zhaoxinii]MCQ2001466.1 hypothetical protein [Arthrobacter zhaoxinii]
MPDPTTRYDVWIPAREWARVRPIVESMNNPNTDGPHLRWPVDPWPVTFAVEDNGDATYSGNVSWYNDTIGESTGYDVFQKPGWTPEKFSLFVFSRHNMHLDLGRRSYPTLAALASYLQTPMVVDEDMGSFHRTSLLGTDGNVALVSHPGVPGTIEHIRTAFFTQDLAAVLAVPGVSLNSKNVRQTSSMSGAAYGRQTQIRDWMQAHVRGKLSAPKGAELAWNDFNLPYSDDIGDTRPVVAWARSSKHLYEVIYPTTEQVGPLEMLCAVDGELQSYVDPDTGVDEGVGAHGADWAQWVLQHSVPEGRRTPKQPWEGNNPEARLYRMEHNIVSYEDHETGTSQFESALELHTWLKRSLGDHNAPISVHVLDDVSFMLAEERLPVLQEHTYERISGPGVKVRYSTQTFFPWVNVLDWRKGDHEGHSWNSSLSTAMDGETLESFLGTNCVDFASLEPYLMPVGAPVRMNTWFLLHLDGTRVCMAFPAVGTMLEVSTDHDGATAQIAAREYSSRQERLDLEYRFQTRWANWLDDDHRLTHTEMREGMKALAELIKENSE